MSTAAGTAIAAGSPTAAGATPNISSLLDLRCQRANESELQPFGSGNTSRYEEVTKTVT